MTSGSPLMGDILERNALLYRDRPAVIFEGRTITFGQLLEQSQTLASAMRAAGMRKGDRVAMLAMNRAEYVDFYGACELTGYIAVPVNFRLAGPETAWILNDVEPSVLLFEGQYTSLLDSIRAELPATMRYVCLDSEGRPDWAEDYAGFLAAGTKQAMPERPHPEDPLCIIYTSGTTGRAKGVIRSHAADAAQAYSNSFELGITPGDRFLVMMPMFHVGARGQQIAAHWHGAALVLHRGFDPGAVLATIEELKITVTHMAPTLLHDVFEHPDIDRRDLSSLKTLFYAAAPMPVDLLRKGLARLGNIFVNGYGSTEIFGITLHKHDHVLDGPQHLVNRLKSVGQPAMNTEVRIVDEDGNPVPPGTIGEIAMRGGACMTGYWNNHSATAKAMRGGWYHSGDMAYADENNFIFLVDRKKDMIISGGENIYSREVENALSEHAAISEVAVIGVPDPRWGESVRALVVLRSGKSATEVEIIEHCKAMIARYKAPKSVLFVKELSRLANGKIDKITLRRLYGKAES
ncbi:long-chain-fatty-acid--CoA ligase [Sphingobium sp. HBC34]|uniref:Long-chain-fatty-acid--CoA ligase n=1 Tax=Sphingobium cyanobacteriorum TaxID=3063954 RepID=A0ABT8ZQ54_9SPHN|nr:long-chain-fatty-acid--CoA ligase [Sphingobium sp. HBC34]MDO7836316.1 long-chain-fatty-acid--CoA ligase [Sphingobium sp. HBC34]